MCNIKHLKENIHDRKQFEYVDVSKIENDKCKSHTNRDKINFCRIRNC